MQKNMHKPANHQWHEAAENVQQAIAHAGQAGSHVVSALGEIAGQACCDLGKKADDLAAMAGSNVTEFGATLGASQSGDGVVGCVSSAIADSVRETGKYIQNAKLSGMANDMSGMIKRNPIPSVLIAACLGWFLARATRK
jgi:hypothetical protein